MNELNLTPEQQVMFETSFVQSINALNTIGQATLDENQFSLFKERTAQMFLDFRNFINSNSSSENSVSNQFFDMNINKFTS